MLTRISFISMVSTVLLSCGSSANLETVKTVDIQKYAGTWYEIARLPNRFEKGMDCVTANYSIKENGKIEVLNKGRLPAKNNKMKDIKGTAWVPDAQFPGRLKVRFFWPFSGDYYIIALNEDYKYALVGSPSRKFLWVLARESQLDPAIYDELMGIAEAKGFQTSEVVKINQVCD